MPQSIKHRLFVTSRFDVSTTQPEQNADYINQVFHNLAVEFADQARVSTEEKYKYLYQLLLCASASELSNTSDEPIDFTQSTISISRSDLQKMLDEGSKEVTIKNVTLCHMTNQTLKINIED